MITNRRKAPFRYKIVHPYECLCQIIRINNMPVKLNKPAIVTLADVSKFGCKVISNLDLNAPANQIDVELHLDMQRESHSINLEGTVKWQSNDSNLNYYGIKFEDRDLIKIMSVLKTFASINLIKLI